MHLFTDWIADKKISASIYEKFLKHQFKAATVTMEELSSYLKLAELLTNVGDQVLPTLNTLSPIIGSASKASV